MKCGLKIAGLISEIITWTQTGFQFNLICRIKLNEAAVWSILVNYLVWNAVLVLVSAFKLAFLKARFEY